MLWGWKYAYDIVSQCQLLVKFHTGLDKVEMGLLYGPTDCKSETVRCGTRYPRRKEWYSPVGLCSLDWQAWQAWWHYFPTPTFRSHLSHS